MEAANSTKDVCFSVDRTVFLLGVRLRWTEGQAVDKFRFMGLGADGVWGDVRFMLLGWFLSWLYFGVFLVAGLWVIWKPCQSGWS